MLPVSQFTCMPFYDEKLSTNDDLKICWVSFPIKVEKLFIQAEG